MVNGWKGLVGLRTDFAHQELAYALQNIIKHGT